MATIVKNSETLNVTIADAFGGKTTFKLNNPVASLTLANVQTAFNNFFGSKNMAQKNLLVNNSGVEYTELDRAEIVETVTRTTALE